MKKLKLLLFTLCLTSVSAFCQIQQIKIVSFTVKNQLPAVIDNWNNIPAALLLVAQLPPTVRVKGIRLMIQIRAGGAIVCSNNSTGGLQVDEFTTRTFTTNELTGSLQGCHDLKDGSYSICAQFFNIDRVAVSNDVCKEFMVETPKETDYAPPTLITPDNGKIYTEAELSRPVTFRWTPLVPKPREPVTYRLKVWQLMEGQNGTQAMRSNQPIVTKEVDNITQTVVNGIYTGPCKPPYLCDFIWQVQAVNKEGKPMGRNQGNSEPYTFKVGEDPTTCSPPKLTAPADARSFAVTEVPGPIKFSWGPVVPNLQEPVTYRLKVWQLMQGQNGTQAMRSNKPVVEKDVMNVTETSVSGLYTGPCKPPYLCDYIWEVQALNREGKPVCAQNEGKSQAFTFKIEDNATPGTTACLPPKLSAPDNGKKFKATEMSVPVLFRWTPLVPKPREPVTYRLRVWQLMQGQNGSQAMRSNKPVVEKDVMDLTETSVSGLYTGPCKPPYLCDFIWEVQALTGEGKPACTKNEGKSEAWSFKVQNNIDIQIDSVKVKCCEKGVQSIYIKVKNNLASSVNIVAVKYKINGVGASITLSPITPVPPQLVVGNGTIVFTATIECNPNINFLKFLVDAEDVADPDNKETEVRSDTLNCICTSCKDIKIQPNEKDKPTVTSTGITQNINFVTGPAKVMAVKMELVWFEFVPESDDCIVCTTASAQMGNFTGGTLNAVAGSGGGTHGLSWNFAPFKDMNGGVGLQYTISYPKMVGCCGAKAKWCIRYTVTYEHCITCSVVVCYEASIKGCNK
ncbi:MAG: hypothetical protein ABIO79_10965 [Ferruginibacter sp.]